MLHVTSGVVSWKGFRKAELSNFLASSSKFPTEEIWVFETPIVPPKVLQNTETSSHKLRVFEEDFLAD